MSATNYLGTHWKQKGLSAAFYKVIDQTGLEQATPQTIGDAVLTLKLDGFAGAAFYAPQIFITLTVRALSGEFERYVPGGSKLPTPGTDGPKAEPQSTEE